MIARTGEGGNIAFGEAGIQVVVISEQGCQAAPGVELIALMRIESNVGIFFLNFQAIFFP